MSSSRLKRLEALRQRREAEDRRSVHDLSDADLLRLCGLPEGATDEDLERLAAGPEGRAGDGSCP